MVKYLLSHRIAVIMTFLALVILGCVTFFSLPVSLMPDIAIPHITVKVTEENMSARELENTIVAPIRRQLMQTGGLSEIKSETRDGSALLSLTMNYGVDVDLAFIEVNEKIDGAMNRIPKSASRPKAMKVSADDIPVLYLQMTLKNDDPQAFAAMAKVADNIIRRRLEQLPEIAMVDVTGVPGQILKITPDRDKMARNGITADDLEKTLKDNNVEPGSMTVRDGYYEYNIHVSNLLRSADDVRNVRIRKGDRLMTIGDFADVALTSQKASGYSTHNGKRAVTLAIVKQSAETMDAMKKALHSSINHFAVIYPDFEFSETRSQTELLDYTISNLKQNLLLGLILVFIVCAIFMGGVRSSFIIGISIIVGVIITFLLFYLFNVSINIISMSGLILAVGMMIDNSVIVTENINQYRSKGYDLMDACAKGTTEMITPMLSSSLTTVAVFVPLVFMSGIAGAIFADQAFSITAGLASSYIVGITLLPVLYYLIENGKISQHSKSNIPDSQLIQHSKFNILNFYDKGIDFCFRHKWSIIAATLLTVPLCVLLFFMMRKERMPQIDSNETIVRIDWNENIDLEENLRRTMEIDDQTAVMRSAYVGPQDFLLPADADLSSVESEVYLLTGDPDDIAPMQDRLKRQIADKYPAATLRFSKAENVFEKIFGSDEANIEARIMSSGGGDSSAADYITNLRHQLLSATGKDIAPVAMTEQIDIAIDRELLAIYNVDFNEVLQTLQQALRGSTSTTLRSFQEYTPVQIAGWDKSLMEVIESAFVMSRADKDGKRTEVPLRNLVKTGRSRDLKTITAGDGGEYVPMRFEEEGNEKEIMRIVAETVREDTKHDVEFAGSFFSNSRMMKELIAILLVSVMLMYFILCAQFGSFLQPLIVLLEIPVDTCFALIALMICGQTLNLMSAIGIIVTCGIVVNDSILKLDAINELRKSGMPLMEAIHTAGRRRLRAIIMTSLTTVFAMLPVLFTSDMGSELQRPLAIAMIGSMIVGTAVSIFVIPVFYRLIYRRHESK